MLCAGRLVYKKGFAVAVAAFARVAARFPEARLVIAGDGPLDGALRAQAVALGVGERVIFAGRVDRARHPLLVAACDLYLLPVGPRSPGQCGRPAERAPRCPRGGLPGDRVRCRRGRAGRPRWRNGRARAGAGRGGAGGCDRGAAGRSRRAAPRSGAAARADVTVRLTWAATAAQFESVYRDAHAAGCALIGEGSGV